MARAKRGRKGRSKRGAPRNVRRALYERWLKMNRRCSRIENADYPRYGGRGIRVAPKWQGADGFENYLRDIVAIPRPDNMSLEKLLFPKPGQPRYSVDRINNDGPYAPDNVRWATDQMQSDNQRGRVRMAVAGVWRTRAGVARAAGVDPRTASYRQRCGYSAEEAATLPTGGRTAPTRDWRDTVVLAMIDAGMIVVDERGFVFVHGADGLYLLRPAPTANGRYLGLSISIPPQFHGSIPKERLAERLRSGQYRDAFLCHRIVALFHCQRPEGAYFEVDHINGDGHDNRPENLRWRLPRDNRPGGTRDRQPSPTSAINYSDPGLQQAALTGMAALRLVAGGLPVTVDEPPMPANLSDDEVAELAKLVKAGPDYPGSIWASARYAPLLPLVLAAGANRAGRFGDGVLVQCSPQVGDELITVYVTALRASNRVFFGCPICGRQSFGVRTEIRNRLRHADTKCESCYALDRVRPDLAAMIAPDPGTAFKRHPSRITAGSNGRCHFRCRTDHCPNVVRRGIKSLVRDGTLPCCEFCRVRGSNFNRG